MLVFQGGGEGGGEAWKNFSHSFTRSCGWKLSVPLNESCASSEKERCLGKRKEGSLRGKEREQSRIKERKKRESLELWILYARGANREVEVGGGDYMGMARTAESPRGNNYILRMSAP